MEADLLRSKSCSITVLLRVSDILFPSVLVVGACVVAVVVVIVVVRIRVVGRLTLITST